MCDAGEVLPDQRVLALGGHVDEGSPEPPARVVHEHVDRPELIDDHAEEVVHGLDVAHVELRGHHAPAEQLDFGGQGVEVLHVPVDDRDVGTEAGEGEGRRPPDAGGGARHDGDPVAEQDGRGFQGHGGAG